MNISLAVDFIKNNGDVVELARLQYLLERKQPDAGVIEQFASDQQSDGGWSPFWASGYSSLDATCFRLAQAEQLGLDVKTSFVQKAVDFLVSRQRADGWFEEDESVIDVAPPWAQPGDEAARLYLTANCGYWLAVLGEDAEHMRTASANLKSAVGADGKMPTFLHSHWLACGVWQRTGQEATVEAVLGFLRSKLLDLSSNNLTWLLAALLSAGVSPSHQIVREAVEHLSQKQRDDGRWVSDDAMERDVHVTLEALRGLQMSGVR